MSYNIDTWKTKKLEDLKVPLQEFYTHERKDFHPEKPTITDATTMEVEIGCMCEDSAIKGILKDGILTVTEIDISGEGSGTFMHEVFEPALRKSTGKLEAILIWEGGDSTCKLKVDDGSVNDEPVEL